MNTIKLKYKAALKTCWQRPTLRTDEDDAKERKASWLALFYDLIFVAVIARLADTLAHSITANGVMIYIISFIPAWWIWVTATYYNERFENNDASHRIFTFLQMIPLALLACTIADAFGEHSRTFALSFATLRIIHVIMWLRVKNIDRLTEKAAYRFGAGYSVSALFWIFSTFTDLPTRYVLWTAGLAIDLITPIWTIPIQARMPKLSSTHIPERFGLLTILALGECAVGIINGAISSQNATLLTVVIASLSLSLAFAVWWVYFDHIIFRPFQGGIWWVLAWSYLHAPIVIAIAAAGAGITSAVQTGTDSLPGSTRWLLCGSVATVLATMSIIGMFSKDKYLHQRVNIELFAFKMGGALLAVSIGLIKTSAIITLAMLTAIMCIQILQGIYFEVSEQMLIDKDHAIY